MSVDPASRGWNEHRHRWNVPAGTIQTADLADGSVTTPKLAPLAVTAADIANGAVGTPQLAAGAAQQQLAAIQTITAWSTTTVGAWLAVTPLTTASVACTGVLTRFEATLTLHHSVVGAAVYVGLGVDGAFSVGTIATFLQSVAGYDVPVSFIVYATPSAANHTFGVWVYNANAGTLTLSINTYNWLYVTEQRR